MKRIAVFASGNGSNFQAIIDGVKKGRIKNAEICLLICDKPKAFCLERAKKAGIKSVLVKKKDFAGKSAFEKEILSHLKEETIDLICLAGYMKILSKAFVKKYKNRILNVHPSLLPSFKGAAAVKDALKYGVKITGATVHFVTENLDAGPIILQEAVKIDKEDTQESLLAKMHKKEHRIYVKAVSLFCKGRLGVVKNRVIIN